MVDVMKKVDRAALKSGWLNKARAMLGGVPFMIFETVLAALIALLRVEVVGAVIFAALLCIKLVLCDDTFHLLLPILLLSAFVTSCYDSFNTFIKFLPLAPIVVFCVIYHFFVYARPLQAGQSGYGLGFVAIAITLGGVGGYGIEKYISGAYYLLGLGLGLYAVYFVLKGRLGIQRDFDVKERFAWVMVLYGTLCAAMVLFGYVRIWLDLPVGEYYKRGVSPNNISTMLMFALPFPVFLSRKYKGLELLSVAFYVAICFTFSRGGLMMGSVELLACFAYWIASGKDKSTRLALCVLLICTVFVVFIVLSDELLYRFLNEDWTKQPRYEMLFEAWDNFMERPLFGTGIFDETIAYGEIRKKGAMCWYHMMIPQIIGSMGVVGIVAYTLQFIGRCKLAFKNCSFWSMALGISYLGLFLMSQVNPGEFCPIPFGLLAVILFIFQEMRLEGVKAEPCKLN